MASTKQILLAILAQQVATSRVQSARVIIENADLAEAGGATDSEAVNPEPAKPPKCGEIRNLRHACHPAESSRGMFGSGKEMVACAGQCSFSKDAAFWGRCVCDNEEQKCKSVYKLNPGIPSIWVDAYNRLYTVGVMVDPTTGHWSYFKPSKDESGVIEAATWAEFIPGSSVNVEDVKTLHPDEVSSSLQYYAKHAKDVKLKKYFGVTLHNSEYKEAGGNYDMCNPLVMDAYIKSLEKLAKDSRGGR